MIITAYLGHMIDDFMRSDSPSFGIWKLVFSVALVIALVLAVFVGARVYYDENDLNRELQSRADIIANRVAAAVSPTIWNIFEKSTDRRYSADVASAILDSELFDPSVIGIIVDGNFGHVFMGKVRIPNGTIVLYDRKIHGAMLKGSYIRAIKGIQQEKMTIGTVRVFLTRSSVTDKLYQGLIFDLIQMVMVVSAIAAAMIFVINRTLIEPTRKLAISKQAFESLSDGLFVTNPDGTLFETNPPFLRAVGENTARSSDSIPSIKVIDQQQQQKLEAIWQNRDAGENWQGEVEIQTADGTIMPAQITISRVLNKGQDTGYKVTVFRDLTDQKQYELRLEELLDEASKLKEFAQQANLSKSEFLANMSHELRTPLNAIIGFSEMMKMDTIVLPEDKQQDYLESIFFSSTHLLNIINDILDLAKVDAGKIEVCMESVNLKSIVEDSVSFLEHQLLEKNISVGFDLVDLTTETDSRLLKQILINIFSNSIKFSPTGGRISASVRAVTRGAEIIIEDKGDGIPEDKLDSVMEPFMQIDNSYSRIHQGTGLGLPLVARFATLIGAKFELQSIVNQGTIAVIRLP
jgi:PAS domain S-box-containing protein